MVAGQAGAPGFAEIGELLMADGVRQYLDPVSGFLLRALNGNKLYLKELEGQPAAPAENPPNADGASPGSAGSNSPSAS
jgi:hypothetical protein